MCMHVLRLRTTLYSNHTRRQSQRKLGRRVWKTEEQIVEQYKTSPGMATEVIQRKKESGDVMANPDAPTQPLYLVLDALLQEDESMEEQELVLMTGGEISQETGALLHGLMSTAAGGSSSSTNKRKNKQLGNSSSSSNFGGKQPAEKTPAQLARALLASVHKQITDSKSWPARFEAGMVPEMTSAALSKDLDKHTKALEEAKARLEEAVSSGAKEADACPGHACMRTPSCLVYYIRTYLAMHTCHVCMCACDRAGTQT